ncbi:M15 family metallopeptidase [Rhodococcus koreensis]
MWRIDTFKPRDYWGFSWDNEIADSNHLSGTAVDLNATRLPWKVPASQNMPADKIATVRQMLVDFEDTIFWGENWNTKDPMHAQINLSEGDPRLDAFAARLEGGYLDVYPPRDPDAFPLPAGYFYGPLDGPAESISGRFETDLPSWKDGLKRWQNACGIPPTGIWDENTARAARALQVANSWPVSGFVYEGEWNAIIRLGQRPDLGVPTPQPLTPVRRDTVWADVSHYQITPVNDSYPHDVLCFRSNAGDQRDTKFADNYDWAVRACDAGRLRLFIVYWFFRPGQANIDLLMDLVIKCGGPHPRMIVMADVEDANGAITGDQSAEVNDEVRRAREWLGEKRVIGYWNPVSNADLWRTRPPNLRLVTPSYGREPGSPKIKPDGYFAHQYTDNGPCPPFGRCDMNYTDLTPAELDDILGLTTAAPTDDRALWEHLSLQVLGR